MAIDPGQPVSPPPPVVPTAPAARGGGFKRLALGCGGTIGAIILLLIAIFAYQMFQAGSIMRAAQEKRTAGDYEGAVTDLLTLIADYSSFDESKEAAVLLPDVRLEWAGALREQGKFEDSLARYDEVSSPEHAEKVVMGKLETELAWGSALVGEQQFADALTHFTTVLNNVPETSDLATQATAALPDVYVGLADQSLAAGDARQAFEHLSFVFDRYPSGPGYEKASASFVNLAQPLYDIAQQDRGQGRYADAERALLAIEAHAAATPLAQQVTTESPAFYLEWGKALAADQQYGEAAKVLQFLLDTYPQSELIAEAEAALIDAEVAAVATSGTAGTLPAPEATGGSGGTTASYEINNDTVCPLSVLMSGPQSQIVKLDPQTNKAVELAAGEYQLVVKINEAQTDSDACSNVSPFTGPSTFESGMAYTSRFYIETTTN